MRNSWSFSLQLVSNGFGGLLILVNYVLLFILMKLWTTARSEDNFWPADELTTARPPLLDVQGFPLYFAAEVSIGVAGVIFGWVFVSSASLREPRLLKATAVGSCLLSAACVVSNVAYPVTVMFQLHWFIAAVTTCCSITSWVYAKHLEGFVISYAHV